MRLLWMGWGGVAAAVLMAALPVVGRGGAVQAAVSKERIAAGAALFHDKGCEFCHGAALAGTERAPDLTAVGKRRKRDYIEQQIKTGGGGMPAFGEVLSGDEVGTLVDFLMTKKKQGPVNAEAMAVPVARP